MGDAGVVDEDVEAPEGRDRAGDEPLSLIAVADVGLVEQRARAELRGGGLALLDVDVADRDLGALAGEALGDGEADALRRPRDHRDLVLQTHAVPPRDRRVAP